MKTDNRYSLIIPLCLIAITALLVLATFKGWGWA